MNEIFEQVEKIRRQQEMAGGPDFAELSTPGIWIELLQHTLRNCEGSFEDQMLEVAALAVWALQTEDDSDLTLSSLT